MSRRRHAVRPKTGTMTPLERLRWMKRVFGRPLVVWILPAAVLIGTCWLGLHFCRMQVAASPQYRVLAPRVGLGATAPPWWEPAFDDEINRSCAAVDGASVLDDDLLARVASGYLRCPWVRQVRWLRKEFPRTISASIDLRWPAAAVAQQNRYYLVGEDGIRLPPVYRQWPPAGMDVPLIVGVRAPVPEPGRFWQEKSVTDAIKIVALLKCNEVINRALRITAVDVRNYHGREKPTESEIVVCGSSGCIIEWGRAPDTDRPGELPVADKLAKLERHILRGDALANRTITLRFAGTAVAERRRGTDGDGI